MITIGEFERLQSEYNELQKGNRAKLTKIWGIVLVGVIVLIVFFLVMFPNQFNDSDTAWILPTYGGMLFLASLIGFLVSIKYNSEKPVYEYIFPELIEKINMNEGTFLQYTPYDKDQKGFNKTGGLFTRGATVSIKRHISGYTEDQQTFHIYDCKMTTSNGKSTQTHFDGIYYVIEKQLNTSIQVRSNGSPRLKGVKFERQPEFEDLKVYKEVGHPMMNIDQQLVQFVRKLEENPTYKRVYLAVVDGEIHVGLWFFKQPARKPKVLTLDTVNHAYNYFMEEHALAMDIAAIDVFGSEY